MVAAQGQASERTNTGKNIETVMILIRSKHVLTFPLIEVAAEAMKHHRTPNTANTIPGIGQARTSPGDTFQGQ